MLFACSPLISPPYKWLYIYILVLTETFLVPSMLCMGMFLNSITRVNVEIVFLYRVKFLFTFGFIILEFRINYVVLEF